MMYILKTQMSLKTLPAPYLRECAKQYFGKKLACGK
jgi:hypothetical protein